MKKHNHIRNHKTVTFYISGISQLAFMAIVTTLANMGYTVSIRDLHNYDDDDMTYSVTFDLDLTARYNAFGISKDWHRMHEAAAAIYSMFKNDLKERRYNSGSISMDFFKDSNDELIHQYTVYTVDYSMGGDESTVKYVRLR